MIAHYFREAIYDVIWNANFYSAFQYDMHARCHESRQLFLDEFKGHVNHIPKLPSNYMPNIL